MSGTAALGDDTISTTSATGDASQSPTGIPFSNSTRMITRSSDIGTVPSGNDPSIPEAYHFEGTVNYGVWSFRIQHVLSSSGLFGYCVSPPSVPASPQEMIARSRVMCILINNAKNSGMKILKRYSEPYACWSYLKRRYESQSGPRKAHLVDKFFALRKTDSVTMDVHLTEVRNVADLLEEVNVVLPEEVIVYYALKNLPKDYDIVRRMLMGNTVLPSYEEMESILLSEEITIGLVNEDRTGEALAVHRDRNRRIPYRSGTSGQTSFTGYAGNTNRPNSTPTRGYTNSYSGSTSGPGERSTQVHTSGTSYQPRFKPRGPVRPRANIVCAFCLCEGHLDRECEIKALVDQLRDMEHRFEEKRRRARTGGQVHVVEETDEHIDGDVEPEEDYVSLDDTNNVEAYVLEVDNMPINPVDQALAVELNFIEEMPPSLSAWHLDSGATHHISGDQSMFSTMQHQRCSGVKSAGGHGHEVLGIGTVNVQFPNGKVQTVPQVLYSPTIRKNLLSVGLIADGNHSLEFLSEGCFIRNRFTREFIAYAAREDRQGLYKLQGDTITNAEVNTVTMERPSASEIWHKRLGHFNRDGLRRMIASNAVHGLPDLHIPDTPCASCFRGKQARTRIPKRATSRASAPLQLVHSDLCGPFRTPSLGGARYFISFVDDYSRFLWVSFLARKDEALDKFKQFHREAEAQYKQPVLTLRTDNGGEFTSRSFDTYCADHGIKRQLTVPYTPQQNGVAERRNRSLLDITRCLLIDKSLPNHLWAEAVRAACEILNVRSSKQTPDVTPTELLTGRKPSVSHLRVFGSTVFVHQHHPRQGKLDSHSTECILLSFDIRAKGYRCYEPGTRKVLVSRDVQILESSQLELPEPSPPTVSDPVLTSSTTASFSNNNATVIPEASPHLPESPLTFSVPTASPNHSSKATSSGSNRLDGAPLDFQSPRVLTYQRRGAPSMQPTGRQPCLAQDPESPISSPLGSPVPSSMPHRDLHQLDGQVPDLPDVLARPHASHDINGPALLPTPPRRSNRTRQAPRHLDAYIATLEADATSGLLPDDGEDLQFKDVCHDANWIAAMEAEYASILRNETWDLMPLPPGKRAITARWIYKLKPGSPGQPPRYKARLVARGFQQQQGIDYGETFAPVVRWETIRIISALAAHRHWIIRHLDVQTAFLNGIIKEEVYMQQPLGFVSAGREREVCKLKRALYGLRQSPRAWYHRIDVALHDKGLHRSQADSNLYILEHHGEIVLLILYVDDLYLTGSHPQLIHDLATSFMAEFAMTDLGAISKYLGVHFVHTSGGLLLHQEPYALSILAEFSFLDCRPSFIPLNEGLQLRRDTGTPPVDATMYKRLVGKLLYLTRTRPDISFATNQASRYMHEPQELHLAVVKGILRYLKRYPSYGIYYVNGEDTTLQGYSDANYAADLDDRISTSAYLFTLGSSPVSWNSKKQSSTARSSCESEYRALSLCAMEATWIRSLLSEIGCSSSIPTPIGVDNQSAIKLANNPVFHDRTKHFEVDWHFCRQKVQAGDISVEYISTTEQPADMLTKALGRSKFEAGRNRLSFKTPSEVLDSKIY